MSIQAPGEKFSPRAWLEGRAALMQAPGEKLPHRQVAPNAQSEAWKFRVDKEERQALKVPARLPMIGPHLALSRIFPHIFLHIQVHLFKLRSRYQDAQALVCTRCSHHCGSAF